jgi:Tfp pilus assembly PilM family ATPase
MEDQPLAGSLLMTTKSKRFLSIDFGRAFTKIIYFESKGDTSILLDHAIKKIPFKEENKSEIAGFISEFLKKKSISQKETCLTLSELDSMAVKTITLPLLTDAETMEAFKWQLNEEMPFDKNASIIDWKVVKEISETAGEKKREIIGVAAKQELVDRGLSITRACNLVPFRISSPFLNYAYLLNRLHDAPTIAAVLDVGMDESTLCIYKDGQLRFLRNIGFSFDKTSRSLTGILYSGKGKMELSITDAENLLKDFGIPEDETGFLRDNIQAVHIISLIRPFLEVLTKELRLTFNYFSSNFKEASPASIYITGEGAGIKHLDVYLAHELKLSVSPLPLPESVQIKTGDKEVSEIERNQIASVVGAMLAGPDAINLLPRELKTKKQESIQTFFLRDLTIVLAAIFIASFLMLNFQVNDYKKRLETAGQHLQAIEQIKILKQSIGDKEALINKLQKGKVPDHIFLTALSAIMPDSIILDELTVDMSKHAVILKGEIPDNANAVEVLVKFIKKIKDLPFFTDVYLVNSENSGEMQVFVVQGDLAQQG